MNYSTKNSLIKVSSLELDLSLIDEDPNQPRTEFDPVTLQELSDTIRLRGVKTPISVHPHPQIEGRFIINHGEMCIRDSASSGASSIKRINTINEFLRTEAFESSSAMAYFIEYLFF